MTTSFEASYLRMWVVCGLLAIVIFIADRFIPLGVAAGVPYMAVVVLTARIPGQRSTLILAVTCSVLTIAGFLLSPAGGQLWQVLLNRALALAVIWAAAAIVVNRKMAADTLERSQASARTKLPFRMDIAAEAIISVDEEQRIVLFNEAAENMFGFVAGEVLGEPIEVLLPSDLKDTHRGLVAGFAEDHDASRLMGERGEIRARRKDGSEFPAKASISILELDGEKMFTAILRDISKYKITQAALDWERTILSTLMDAWPDLVYVKDRENRFLAANAKTAEIMGAGSPENLIGRTDLDYYPPELAACYMAEERQLIASGRATMGQEEKLITPNGDAIWFSSTKVPLMREGKAVGLIGVNRDITVRKQEERALNEAKKQAEVASRAKSEFLANMSHELRTPLNAIIGFSEIIAKQSMGPLGDDRYCDYGRDINEAGQHLLELINDILDLSKVESGMDELCEEVVAVGEIADSVIRLLRDRASEAGVDLVKEMPNETTALFADARKLKQILANLLSNAVKFTEAGGRVMLRISCSPIGGYVFEIRDTGIGIDPADIPSALSLFGQVDGKLNRAREGTGLGLPLTKALVELHDATFEIESEVGSGTTVTLSFPATRTVAGNLPTYAI